MGKSKKQKEHDYLQNLNLKACFITDNGVNNEHKCSKLINYNVHGDSHILTRLKIAIRRKTDGLN